MQSALDRVSALVWMGEGTHAVLRARHSGASLRSSSLKLRVCRSRKYSQSSTMNNGRAGECSEVLARGNYGRLIVENHSKTLRAVVESGQVRIWPVGFGFRSDAARLLPNRRGLRRRCREQTARRSARKVCRPMCRRVRNSGTHSRRSRSRFIPLSRYGGNDQLPQRAYFLSGDR